MITKRELRRKEDAIIEKRESEEYLTAVIHAWSKVLAILAMVLVPGFFILDYVTTSEELIVKFALLRSIATVIPLIQLVILNRTEPSWKSYIHGYVISLVVGGAIVLMTLDLGGFDARYYAGLNLVIIGTCLVLPWRAKHSAFNGLAIIMMYIIANIIAGHDFSFINLIMNLFFMSATLIMGVSITHLRYRLIIQEYSLRTQLRSARDLLWSEMEIAKKIQTALLPTYERVGGYSIASIMIPAAEVGGDYYDVIVTRHGEKWLAIGDVSGHGVESGLIMMMTQTSILTMVNSGKGLEPSQVLGHVNNVIMSNIGRLTSSMYMTIMLIRLDERGMTVAGRHQNLLIYRSAGDSIEELEIVGTWIGITESIEDYLIDYHIDFNPGDTLLLFTDGITESPIDDTLMYGDERLKNIFLRHGKDKPQVIRDAIVSDLRICCDEQDDDYSVMVVKREY